ncbi:MAG: hypothetical protein WC378_13075 [Opitutaceae bacterium]|jgi:hypothetical protein
MGFFDLLKAKRTATPQAIASPKLAPQPSSSAVPEASVPPEPSVDATPLPSAEAMPSSEIMPRLAQARTCLEAKDLPGALALYEQALAGAGDRADVLVSISGDLGTHGHVQQLIELIAPRYDAQKHGPATGINLLQAYLFLRNPEAARHMLDVLSLLNRSDIEETLHGFSNAIAEMIEARQQGEIPDSPGGGTESGERADIPRISLITISKPIWFYGLEALAGDILPPKGNRLRRVAFTQLGLPGIAEMGEAMKKPEDELGRLSRALPLLFAENLFFCPHYSPVAAVGVMTGKEEGNAYALFGAEWTPENIRQLQETGGGEFDFVFTGSLQRQAGDIEMTLRLWEIRKFRERKKFVVRWAPATADAELGRFISDLRLFMEWQPYPAGGGIPYSPPASTAAWLDTLGASLGLFLAEKKVLPPARLAPVADDLRKAALLAPECPLASLSWLTLGKRAQKLGLAQNVEEAVLFPDPIVQKARAC